MKTSIISVDHSKAITTALRVLELGGIVAFPTDTVYGVGASVNNPEAIEKLFTAKGRDFNKAIAVLIGDQCQLSQLTLNFNESAQKLAERFWPGALTLVVDKSNELPQILSPLPTIGIRMPDHAFVRKLLMKSGPLATTSANISGGDNPLTAEDVLSQLEGKIDLLIDGGKSPGGMPSTVVDCTREKWMMVRVGAIPENEIKKTLS